MLITPTQMNKGDIQLENLVFMDLAGNKVEGANRPTGEVPMYVNFFKTIKGFYNTNMMHVHAIVGDAPSGCSTSGAGAAEAGHRYIGHAGRV